MRRLSLLIISILCMLTGGARADSAQRSEAPSLDDDPVDDLIDDPFQQDLALILASHLFRAHHEADLKGLQDLAGPGSAAGLDWAALESAFRRQMRELLPASQVTCAAERGDRLQPVPDRLGGQRRPQSYRCELPCVRGSYTVHALFGPSDPLIVPAPRPGPLLKLWIDDPVPAAADAWLWRSAAAGLLVPLWALALRLLWTRLRRRRTQRDDHPPRDAFARLCQRALWQLSGTAQLLAAAAVAGLLAPWWWHLTLTTLGSAALLCLLGILGCALLATALLLGGLAHWAHAL